jgi:6-phosphogluconolactonase
MDPKARYLIASGERSDKLSVFAIDQASGAPKHLPKCPTQKGFTWVEIVSFE